jgi:DNA ligase D-like protein (predicted 3'-phosphoesterase)
VSAKEAVGVSAKEPLADYRRKRDFGRTGEPRGGEPAPADEPVFVVQIHDARRMHFDFRLEVDGVLKSWAVPKGPSADPHDKRLAMPTEDHPIEYRDFEGVIAPGEYGAGTVIVWDEGGYRNLSKDRSGREVPFAEALRRGHASFRLDGTKLHGGYALTRFRDGGDGSQGGGRGSGEAWLLVRRDDGGRAGGGGERSSDAPDPVRARSVRTGRTLKQVAASAAATDGSSDSHGSGGGGGGGRGRDGSTP